MADETPESIDYLRGKVDALAGWVDKLHADQMAHNNLCATKFGVLISAVAAATAIIGALMWGRA